MSSQIMTIRELIDQLYKLGFTPSQVDTIIVNIAGNVRFASLPPVKLQKLIKELENCIWFSRRCQSIS